MANAQTSARFRQQLARNRESALFSREERHSASCKGRIQQTTERKVSEPLPVRKTSASFDLVSSKNAKRYSDVTRPTSTLAADCCDEAAAEANKFDQTLGDGRRESSSSVRHGGLLDLEKTRRLHLLPCLLLLLVLPQLSLTLPTAPV
jgi:hypothetical protein